MKRNIYLMYAIAFLQGMVFYGPVATLYRQSYGVSVFQITLIEGISLMLCILLEMPWGIVADKIGYKRTMVFCCVLYFASKIVFWRAAGFGWFLAERVMISVVIAGLSGVDTSILYLSCQNRKSQKVFGIYNSLQMAGLLVAAMVFSLFVGENYRLSGLLTVISYGFAAILSLGLYEVKKSEKEEKESGRFKDILMQTLCNRNLLLFLAGVAFLSESHQVITVFLSQLQFEKCGLAPDAIGYIYIVTTLLGGCGIYSLRLTKKAGIKRMALLLGGAGVFSCMILAITSYAMPSVFGIWLFRLSNSLFEPFQTEMQNRQIHTRYRATALSIHAMIIDCIGAGTSMMFGFLAQKNLQSAFFWGVGLCVASVFLFWYWYQKTGTGIAMHQEEKAV